MRWKNLNQIKKKAPKRGETFGGIKEGIALSIKDKTEIGSVKHSGYILENPHPVLCDEMALLALLADAKAYVSFRDAIMNHKPLAYNNVILTSAEYAKAFHALSEELETIKTSSPANWLTSHTVGHKRAMELDILCPQELQSRVSSRIGQEREKIRIELSSCKYISPDERNRLKDGRRRAKCIATNIKKCNGRKTIGTVFKVLHDCSLALFGNDEFYRDNYRRYLDQANLAISIEILNRSLDEKLASLFGEGRGQRLMTLFGLPGEPVKRGDLVGLSFGLVRISKPKRVRSGWAELPATSTTTFSVQCICGESLPKKVSFYDLQRGRSFSCGCVGQKNYSKKWHDDAVALAHDRFNQKRLDKKRSDRVDFRFWVFESFLKFMGLPWSKDLEVSRINDHVDPFVSYEPGGCCWESARLNRSRAALARKALKLIRTEDEIREKALATLRKNSVVNESLSCENLPFVPVSQDTELSSINI